MTLQSLHDSLQAQATKASKVQILQAMSDAGMPPAADFSDLLRGALMVASDLTVTVPTIPQPTSSGLDFAGPADALGLTGATIALHFTDDASGAGVDLRLVVTLPAKWTFGQSFPGIVGCDADRLDLTQQVFVLTTKSADTYAWKDGVGASQTTQLKRGLTFVADLKPTGLLNILAQVIQGGVTGVHIPFAGPVDPTPLARKAPSPDMTIEGAIAGSLVSVPYFSLSTPQIILANIPGVTNGPGAVPYVALATTLGVKGKTLFTVSSPIHRAGSTLTFSIAADKDGLSLTDICSLVGGDAITGSLPPFLKSAFSAVGFKGFRLALFLSPLKISRYGVTVGATQPWRLGNLTVDELTLDYSVIDPMGSGKQSFTFFNAKVEFFPNIFEGRFDLEIGEDSGGETQVLAGYTGTVSLNDLIKEISNDTIDLPQEVVDITFSDFAVSFTNTGGTWDWTLFGRCDVAFPLPLVDGKADAGLNVLVTSAGGQLTYKLQGSLLIGSSYFEVDLDLGQQRKQITGKWQAQGARYLGFNNLAEAMDLPSPGIPSDLDLALSEATVAYDFTDKRFMIEATSKNYGKAIFVCTKPVGGVLYAFGLDIHLGVTLANLPLVGDKLPNAEDLGIDTLNVWVLSRTLKKIDAEAVNALILPTQFPPLPDKDINSRVLLDGTLRLGSSDGVPLSVGLGGAGATTPPAMAKPAGAPPSTPPPPKSDDGTEWIDVQRQIGIFQFNRVGIGYSDGMLRFLLDAGIDLGPLALSMDGLSIGSELSKFTPSFDLSGLGLAYNSPPLEIAGALLKLPGSELAPNVAFQFDGSVIIKAETFSIAGIGSYAQTTAGDPSLFLFAQLEEPLGGPPAFFVTGLMAGFGFNRSLTIPTADEVLNFPLLTLAEPPAPGQPAASQDPMNVLRILEGEIAAPGAAAPKAWIAPRPGALWVAVGVMFTSFEIVRSKALVVVEPLGDFTLSLLGLSTLQLPLPTESAETYAYVELQLSAIFRPDDGVFSVTAILSKNSFVLTPACHLTGGFAFYLWFGSNPRSGQFVVTMGGYHPAFKPPSYYPQVPRLGFNWAVSDCVTIKGDAYFALTPSCAMAGGGLEVLFHDGDLSAWFTAHADVLISWRPFFFLADIDVSIGVSYRLNLLFCHKTISLSIGASVDMWGPPTGGTVHVHLVIVTFTVHFGSDSAGQDQQPIDWDGLKSLLPHPKSICTVTASAAVTAMADSSASSSGKRWIVRPRGFSFDTKSAIPASQLQVHSSTPQAHLFGVGAPTAGIAIRPMNKADVISVHEIKVSRDTAAAVGIDLTGWTLEERTQGMPEALWSAPTVPFDQIPGQPSAKVIPGLKTGYSVGAPQPTLGAACGPVPFDQLAEEYLKPPGEAPISPAVTATSIYLPTPATATIGDIAAVMSPPSLSARNALFGALSKNGVYDGSNGSLGRMAAEAAHLFADCPMQQA